MPGLREIASKHTELTEADLDQLRRLLTDWQLLADLGFSDLVLWLPTWNRSGYVAAAQRRPTTGPTVFTEDRIGTFLPRGRQGFVDVAASTGQVVSGSEPGDRAIPVPGSGGVIGVIAAQSEQPWERERSRLEQTYVDLAGRLASMVSEGTFPATGLAYDPEESPRVGDGILVLDTAGSVAYASPNALSAYRRLGLAADLVGTSLAQTTRLLSPVRSTVEPGSAVVLAGRAAGSAEVEAKGAVVSLRSIPLLEGSNRTGALLLLRDVSDLRQRERELITKDATIREIHHRVKNNLQTVAALLRLQARRVESPGAVAALTEAERRVASIAVVHETLSSGVSADVPFDVIADRLLAMAGELPREHVGGDLGTLTATRVGTFGVLDADLATPLALVINELLHNAVEHGLAGAGGRLVLRPERTDERLTVTVEDDGVGLPADFDSAGSARLGLQISRTLLADLSGEVTLQSREGGGTVAVVHLPLP